MKRFHKSCLFFFIFIPGVFSSVSSWAVNNITFDGPKYTYMDDEKSPPLPMVFPGNFSVYNFFPASDKPDLAVPTYMPDRGTVQGLDNQSNWGGPDNSYFLHHYLKGGIAPRPNQVLTGDFNGNGAIDLAILGTVGVVICYDYNGDSCTGGNSAPKTFSVNDSTGKPFNLFPWAGAVGIINNDARDDVAIAAMGYDPVQNTLVGYLLVWTPPTTSGGADEVTVFGPTEIANGIPFSITLGDFNGDSKLDVATASRSTKSDESGVLIDLYLNNNAGSLNAAQEVASFNKLSECRTPTGLISYD